ncbi:class I SAM-dependent methyltransferase [Neptuniibacter sp.]|uniref:class I SAM-dependent methyltransferase n=1 Tax=Neptuniibacter sp. TaxID=1962643 RepID=UPI003B5B1E5D
MHSNKTDLLNQVATYYAEKLAQHGDTPRGVDWNGEASQKIRFEQLCKIVDPELPDFTLSDLGCGYGALLEHLHKEYSISEYLGVDVSSEMIKTAIGRNSDRPWARFITAGEPDKATDYAVASGIFNVRLDRTDEEWFEYFQDTLDILDRSSKLGFSFNCLTSYSDEDKKRDYLYYADPCQLFDLCKRRYSKEVALLHDYGLYEFTILVRTA